MTAVRELLGAVPPLVMPLSSSKGHQWKQGAFWARQPCHPLDPKPPLAFAAPLTTTPALCCATQASIFIICRGTSGANTTFVAEPLTELACRAHTQGRLKQLTKMLKQVSLIHIAKDCKQRRWHDRHHASRALMHICIWAHALPLLSACRSSRITGFRR